MKTMRPVCQHATWAVVVAVGVAGLCGCGARVGGAAPPLKFCGQTLYTGAAGAVPTDATTAGTVKGVLTVDSAVFIELTHNCTDGATITVVPSSGATIVHRFLAKHDGLVAVEVRSLRAHVTVVVTRADHSHTTVRLPHPVS